MNKLLSGLLLAVGGISGFACGSSDSGSSSGAGGNGATSCVPAMYQADATAECTQCIESKCSSQYQALGGAHCNSGSAGSPSMACANAVIAIGECGDSNCPVCVPSSGGSGGGGTSSGTAGTHAGGSTSTGAAGSSATGTGEACTIGGQICNWYPNLPAAMVDNICSQSGGVSSAHCASSGLSGCCAQTSGTLCYYGVDAASLQSACTQSGGTWSSSAP